MCARVRTRVCVYKATPFIWPHTFTMMFTCKLMFITSITVTGPTHQSLLILSLF
ncbi:hypothetical protein MtrunA17_Chr7g0215481 [Medicago truncatula]|uniref:Uncharacterized protein n=1 Tax=Medicago truncatula TaxID=3880 RepID=A0A396GSI6_MEDTR|nr:hypothetical protein MtrunA17_Chr7g0215481 [Medicago truncatula]